MMTNIGTMILHVETNFQHTNEKVLAMTDESQKAAQQSVAISETIAQISAGAENSATAVQTTVASVEEVTRIAGEVLHQAKSTKEVSQGMVEELGKSRGVISSLVEGISVLAKEHEVSLQSVHQLEEHARKVEQIISMVGDIAEQTNLLALNASIEAARAGEHGKGFAVVAEEVRQLADESAKAVKGISGLVQNIQREVKQVVAHITEQVSSAQSEAKKGEETNSAMEAMTKSVNDVAGAVEMISTLVDEQMTQIQKTSSQSQEVAAIAEQTSAGAQQVASATEEQTAVMRAVEELAQELQAQAAQLKETIDQLNR
ncbi:methyl-accepting chemotaxis protein [Bacillus fonticola]|uniref:methyl-accepting chemotaxis protein n=1 Tax=Bacillus fonticola TaxID=2728853 RepID=UPI003899393B